MPDARVESAIAHWAPRMTTQGIDLNDFTRTTARIETWDEWLGEWVRTGELHLELAREAESEDRTRTAGEAFVRAAGARLHHVKCHGQLYNMAANDEPLSDACARAVKDLGGDVILYALSGSRMMERAAKVGVRAVAECFADRGYNDDGTLAPLNKPGGLIEDEKQSVALDGCRLK